MEKLLQNNKNNWPPCGYMKTIHNINTLQQETPGTSAETDPRATITKYLKTTNSSLEVVLARMCAYDRLPFKIFITLEDLRIGELPKSGNTIRKIIIVYSNQIRNLFVEVLAKQKENKTGFSLTSGVQSKPPIHEHKCSFGK